MMELINNQLDSHVGHDDSIIYPVTDKHKWATRYSLPVDKLSICPKCGVELCANIPFAVRGWRGFVSTPHECGTEYDLTVAAQVNESDRKALISAFNLIATQL